MSSGAGEYAYAMELEIKQLEVERDELKADMETLMQINTDLLNEREEAVAELMAVLRCEITRNLCGTDTWAVGKPCQCAACVAWVKYRAGDG